jgi:hypothetical protein
LEIDDHFRIVIESQTQYRALQITIPIGAATIHSMLELLLDLGKQGQALSLEV